MLDGLSRAWPDRGAVLQGEINRHYGYTFQWYAMALAIGLLAAVLRSETKASLVSNEVNSQPTNTAPKAQRHRLKVAKSNRLILVIFILVCAAPVIASYLFYFVIKPDKRTNYGDLIDPQRSRADP